MADYQDRPPVGLQVFFQPIHCLNVQMVGGLVQNQQVRALQQQSCQAQTRLFAAGKHTRRFFPGFGRESHTVEDFLDLGIHLVSIHGVNHRVAMIDFFLYLRIFRFLCQFFLQRLQLLHGFQGRRKGQTHRSVYIQIRIQVGILLQISAGHTIAKRGRSRIRQGFPVQNPKKRRLTRSVGANNSDPVAALHTGIDIFQNFMFAKTFSQFLQFQQHNGFPCSPLLKRCRCLVCKAAALGPSRFASVFRLRCCGGGCARQYFPVLPVPSRSYTVPHRSEPHISDEYPFCFPHF